MRIRREFQEQMILMPPAHPARAATPQGTSLPYNVSKRDRNRETLQTEGEENSPFAEFSADAFADNSQP